MHLNDILPIAAVAWSNVKAAADPEFNNCALSHREKLIAEAEGVVRTGSARTDFEKAFVALLDEFKAAQNPAPATSPAEAAIESALEAAGESEEGAEVEEGAGEASAEGSAAVTKPTRTRSRKSSSKDH